MREFFALLKREWLEHRTVFVWGPVVVLGLMVLAVLMALLIQDDVNIQIGSGNGPQAIEDVGEGREVSGLEALTSLSLDVTGSSDTELAAKLNRLLFALVQPFHLLFLIFVFFALIAALFDERKDHSVLFWKSMPVSDLHSVASKFAFVAWGAPICTIAAIFAAQVFAVIVISTLVEEGMGSRIWGASEIILRPVDLVLAYAIHSLWAVPFYGWLLLISAWVSRGPILWAIGVPVLVVILERIVLGSSQIAAAISNHFSNLQLTHGPLIYADGVRMPVMFDRFSGFGELNFWLGIAVGAAFVAAAVYLRRYRNEI